MPPPPGFPILEFKISYNITGGRGFKILWVALQYLVALTRVQDSLAARLSGHPLSYLPNPMSSPQRILDRAQSLGPDASLQS